MIECTALTKSYRAHSVLRGIDLTIPSGICSLLGANGAGKSTLLRLLSGLEKPDRGSVEVFGMRFAAHPVEIKKRMGIVPEGLGLFESLTVAENLSTAGPLYGLTSSEIKARTADLLETLELRHAQHTAARECSFGMRKKTALAMALLHKPDVLLLDEPFEGIDPTSSLLIQRMLRTLAGDGASILFTSHILPVVQTVSDRVLILHNGEIASDFHPSEMTASVEETYFALVGSSDAEVPGWLRS